MSRSKPLRDSIKAEFYPFALQQGFIRGKATSLFVPFRRIVEDKVHVFEIQWDKYHHPRFVVNFGEAPKANVVDLMGNTIHADVLDPVHCPLQGRLQRWRGGSLRTWFQTRKPWAETLLTLSWSYSPEEVTAQLIDSFSELETWWESKQEGPHVYIRRHVARKKSV